MPLLILTDLHGYNVIYYNDEYMALYLLLIQVSILVSILDNPSDITVTATLHGVLLHSMGIEFQEIQNLIVDWWCNNRRRVSYRNITITQMQILWIH